jgi:outer membrane protein OmpA-like peptidoglycan-associated protein
MKTSIPNIVSALCFLLVFLLVGPLVMAQKKSDLIVEIDSLQAKVRRLEKSVSEAQSSDKASQAKASSYEEQVIELKEANATLMANLGSFANVSNKKESALSTALESLNAKERQLKGIETAFSANDSTIIVLLNDAKRTLGPDAQLKVAAGSLVISGSLSTLFGSDTGTTLTEAGNTWAERVAALSKAHPAMGITVEGLSMTGDMSLPANQATAVMNALQGKGVSESRMQSRARDGNFSEGVDILLHPDYRRFYQMVQDEVKR